MWPRVTHPMRPARFSFYLAALASLLLAPIPAPAHDPDTYGGLFRTHDTGATWSAINPGIYASGALALAVSPRDPNHLLLASDSGVWRSRNGGRDWTLEAQDVLRGAAFAIAFDGDGEHAMAASGTGLFRNDGDGWRTARAPSGSAPARMLIASAVPGRVYLVGNTGLHRSDDFGRSWSDIAGIIKGNYVDMVVESAANPNDVYAVASGWVWSSTDAGKRWKRRLSLESVGGVDAVGLDPANPASVWAASTGQVFRSDDRGEHWRAIGKRLPETTAKARAVVVSGSAITIATDRGLFRSGDAGESWEQPKENLPAHLGAGMLVRDARKPTTLYAGFAAAGYDELRARLPQNEPAAWWSGIAALGGKTALVLLALAAIAATWHFARARGHAQR
jgi:photosystem II stability/assembly factor-like uncharacterized protein